VNVLLPGTRHPLVPLLVRPGTAPGLPLVPGHLDVAVATCTPDGLRPLDQAGLDALALPLVDLVHRALWALRRLTDPDDLVPMEALDGLWQVVGPEGTAASRMLCLDELFRPWPTEGVVACCPGSDRLLVVPLDDLAALPALQALLGVAREAHRRPDLSDQLFWSEDGVSWTALPVRHDQDRVDLLDAPAFVAAVERMMAVELVSEPAEA
jgi:hypothetical protein